MVIINKIFHLYHGNHSYKIMTNLMSKGKRAKGKTREVRRALGSPPNKTLPSLFFTKKKGTNLKQPFHNHDTFFKNTLKRKPHFPLSFPIALGKHDYIGFLSSFLFFWTLSSQPKAYFPFLQNGPPLHASFPNLFIAKGD